MASGPNGTFTNAYVLDAGVNRILFRAVDALGNRTDYTRYVFRGDPNEPAADSTLAAERAPTYDDLAPRSFKDAVRFLYDTGAPPLQQNVDDDSVAAELAAVVRGQVCGRDWGALRNAEISVLGHPGLGSALTRQDGRFDLGDALGNLMKVRLSASDSVEYVVDGRSRRVARIANGDTTHRWLYEDQLELVAEVDGAGAVVTRYVYGTKRHVPDYRVRGGTTYRVVTDHLGSVRMVVVAASGAVAAWREYDAWGTVTARVSRDMLASR